ncbi:hypothetical protein PIB30_041487 [Stylosanthes scabra]|uniref:3'-5' exonuclease domain-containing protein n=1 Tax=Stylosanthes scabra TaxID=79078 RepID=A0ABU6SFT1_9FABA|nr:hypothetical protein [Stylosanthes scabra]
MTIFIRDYNIPGDTHDMYQVGFHGNFIETIKTASSASTSSGPQTLSATRLATAWPLSNSAWDGTASNNTFVGVGIEADAQKLLEDYNLRVANCTDLGRLAEHALGEREMRNASLTTLAARVMEVEFEKHSYITRSNWGDEWLHFLQVQYACADAFVSYDVGRILFLRSGNTSNRF